MLRCHPLGPAPKEPVERKRRQEQQRQIYRREQSFVDRLHSLNRCVHRHQASEYDDENGKDDRSSHSPPPPERADDDISRPTRKEKQKRKEQPPSNDGTSDIQRLRTRYGLEPDIPPYEPTDRPLGERNEPGLQIGQRRIERRILILSKWRSGTQEVSQKPRAERRQRHSAIGRRALRSFPQCRILPNE